MFMRIEDEDERMEKAAVAIQSLFRGFSYRNEQNLKELQQHSAKLIQTTWRSYVDRCKIHRCVEILALFRIGRCVSHYRLKRRALKEKYRLEQFDRLLAFYPTQTNIPDPPRKRGRRRGRGRSAATSYSNRSSSPKAQTARSSSKKLSKTQNSASARRIPEPMMTQRRAITSTRRGPPRKRKILVELPLPWHDKNPKRLSQAQQDDAMFNQKNTFAWAKKELIPLLWRHCLPNVNARDELRAKNQRYIERIVSKPFICPVSRGMKASGVKIPKDIRFIGNGCLSCIVSSSCVVFFEPKTLSADNIISQSKFDVESPLFDVAVHPFSGYVVGLDSSWCLRLFEHQRTILTHQFTPLITIPKAQHYLHFDKFGMLWVNLFPQRDHLYLIDPLTLFPSVKINIDNVCAIHRNMRQCISLIPLNFNNQPFGFAGLFSGSTDVFIFSNDFQRSRKLTHSKMKGFPSVKQCHQRVYVWSIDCVIYVYDLKEYMEGITLSGTIKTNSTPTDVCETVEPSMIFVSCEDFSLHCYLGKSIEFALRLSSSRMDRDEQRFCDILLGKQTFTQSRSIFREMGVHKFTMLPTHIDACIFSEKMTLITASGPGGTISSVWMVNDSQPVRCMDFDSFKYSAPQMSAQLASADFNEECAKVAAKRTELIKLIEFFAKFDNQSNTGLMSNLFNPANEKFMLIKYFVQHPIRQYFPFIPDYEGHNLSVYEVFHFLIRTGMLPEKISTFDNFLNRYAQDDVKRTIPTTEIIFNQKLPVRTRGLYNAITDIRMDLEEISKIADVVNPLSQLKELLGKYTVESTMLSGDTRWSTPRTWINGYKRREINCRVHALSMLEDLVKHELMNRVQTNIDRDFKTNLYNKMQPVSSIDIKKGAPKNEDSSIQFTTQPNRNPLLDEKRHKSIYDTWSKYIYFGRDTTLQMDLRALHIPCPIFQHSQVGLHFDLIRKVAFAAKKVSSIVHSFMDSSNDNTTRIVVTEDSRALPLSHYLTIHSFLGGTPRLTMAVRSILGRLLINLHQLHKSGIIVRTICPDNILLNATNLSVLLGNVYDCQQMAAQGQRAIYLPLPDHFAKADNPFLPPEYFHEPPRKHTTSFDIWQFGILLLYVITGFLPHSYGSELMKHVSDDTRRPKEARVQLTSEQSELDDPPCYPRCNFFYDWLNLCPVVPSTERCVGERGECFITTTNPGPQPSILELDNYKLLSYKNTKINYDEARLFLEIIASCLQIDPDKRPTTEQLLRTYPFNQTNQITDILSQYIRDPDPNIFVSQFFVPVLKQLNDKTFSFTIGIISAILFFDEMNEEDAPYAFPLDSHATEKVIASLFQLKFMDQLVTFVLNRVAKNITISDVNPAVTYQDSIFESLLHFFTRFVASIEKGTGFLLPHVDEVIMSMFALYTGNPFLRIPSSQLLASPSELFKLATSDSACVFVYTHTKAKALIKYALQVSVFIQKSLKRSPEHNDNYFEQFIDYGEAVYNFSHALCFTVEKQRANGIKTMAGMWKNGESVSVVRLFIDFRILQKVIHCFHMQSARNDAASFICSAFRSARIKSFDPTFKVMQAVIHAPTVYTLCSQGIRGVMGNESLRQPSIEIVRSVLFGESAAAINQLVIADIFWGLADNSKETVFRNLLTDVITSSSIYVLQIIMSSNHLQRTFRKSGIEFVPRVDYRMLTEQIDYTEALSYAKRLAASLYIRQTTLPKEMQNTEPPIQPAVDFFIRCINMTTKECDVLAKQLDAQVVKATRFDLNGSMILKAKAKSKETTFANSLNQINDMCKVLLHLFRCLCFYWIKPDANYPKNLFDFIFQILTSEIPSCKTISHPVNNLHHCIQMMLYECISNMPSDSIIQEPLKQSEAAIPKIFHRDILFFMHCVDKNVVPLQVMSKYPEEKRIRMNLFKIIITKKRIANLGPLFRIIINEMLANTTELKLESSFVMHQTYHFPLRSEGLSMIIFLLEQREKYEFAAKKMADELYSNNFIETERKITVDDDNHNLVNSSILFLQTVVQCVGFFNELAIKKAQSLLESLCMRFSREPMNISEFERDPDSSKRLNGLGSLMRESWSRPVTTIQKKRDDRSAFRSARTSAKPTRPATQFGLKRPLTPR